MMSKYNYRPWGWWRNLYKGPGYLVKIIFINDGEQLSLQTHKHRDETWVIADGEGEVFCNGFWQHARKGKCYHVPVNSIHRAKGGKGNLLIVETQHGDKLSEDDIERLEDDYGRVTKVKDDTKT